MYSFQVTKDGFELTDRSTGLIVKTGTFKECCRYIIESENKKSINHNEGVKR